MNYVGKVNTPKLESTHIAKIKVPTGGLHAGQVVYCEDLDATIPDNFEIYAATKPITTNFGSKNLAVVLNGGFETIADGRRPNGQPDDTKYTYQAGDIATVVFIDRHLSFSISADSIDANTIGDIAVGKYLIPLNNSNSLAVASSVPDTITTALKVVGVRSLPVGGEFGLGYATTYICITHKDDIVDSGNFIKTFSLPNQVGTSVINNTAGTISVSIAGSLTSLVATFTNSKDSVVKIGDVVQVSGVTPNTFEEPVTYVVTSEGGVVKNYVVTATLAEYVLETTSDENTTVTITRGDEPITDEDELVFGDVLTISATYATGSEKDVLTVNGEAFTSGDTHTVDGDVTVVATSKLTEYTLTINDTSATTTITKDDEPIITGATIYYGDELVISTVPVEPATSVVITVNDEAFTSGETYNVVGNATVVSIGS